MESSIVCVGVINVAEMCQYYTSRNCSEFCFFKQKTAYDMRISDWSSDVCSSDLRLAAQGHGPVQPPAQHRDRVAAHFDPLPVWHPPFEEDAVTEIGRASCRARVCQYV